MSAVRPATFTGFDPYKLTGVRVTDRDLGHGSYATVLELEYMGLKCAGKKIHELLLEQGGASYPVRRFEEECHLLSQVRHPNIVQFLGVYFQQGVRAPILVMEFLPTNLTSCIEQYGIFPKEISYSILHDVALGLCYLHSQTPPIIHRDLSSNNVLLTPNMTAKISDLGVARILDLTPLQVSRMTQTPGTPAYMPPEVMVANPKYDTSVDEFSYGIMMIHMFSGRWPEPQVGPVRAEPGGRMIPVSEAERREVFLQAIGNDHPLIDLIRKSIDNYPQTRAHASEIVERLTEMMLQFPAPFANRLEMLIQIEADKEEKRALTEEGERKDRAIQEKEDEILISRIEVQTLTREGERKDREIQQKEHKIATHREEVQAIEEQRFADVEQLKLAHSCEVEQLRLQIRDLNTQNQLMKTENAAEIAELRTKAASDQTRIENLVHSRDQTERQLAEEREACCKLKANLTQSRSEIEEIAADNAVKDSNIFRKDSELEAKSRALEEKDATISAMSEQLTKIREYLVMKKQDLSAVIVWKECAELLAEFGDANSVVINGKVYCGGGVANYDEDEYTVYCYDPLQDKWTTLPPLPVKWFGLGQVYGELVAVGGWRVDKEDTNEIYTYDERSQKWKQTIPPMPTARRTLGVLSLQSALVVAGGYQGRNGGTPFSYTAAVEIFRPDTSQWYKTDPLPTACRDISLVAIGNTHTCYALGGCNDIDQSSSLNQALYASIDDLLGNAIPTNQTTHSGSSDTQSTWKTLPNTQTYEPHAAVLAGNLLAIGGEEAPEGRSDKQEIYMYSPSTNSWIYISDLPAPRSGAVVAVLSTTEILVIGGWSGHGKVNTVYKGTLHLKL